MSEVTPNETVDDPGRGVVEGADATTDRREIGHDEFDPIGTLVLIAIYFLLLVFLWLFTYFVEFLGNGPTVVGAVGTVVGTL